MWEQIVGFVSDLGIAVVIDSLLVLFLLGYAGVEKGSDLVRLAELKRRCRKAELDAIHRLRKDDLTASQRCRKVELTVFSRVKSKRNRT